MSSDGGEGSIALALLAHFSMLSLMAIGGGVLVLAPEMQRFVVDAHHWVSNEAFVAAYTLAQVAPGPNAMFVTVLGLQAAGLLGALAATIAVVVPPAVLTMIALKISETKSMGTVGRVVKTALAPLSVGMMLAAAWAIARAADQDWQAIAVTLITAALMLRTKINPLWLILVGAVLGVVNGGL